MQNILDQVEGRRTEITQADLDSNFGTMVDLNNIQLSSAIYHMLNQLLSGEAHKELSNLETAQGLEVWRRITINLTDKGPLKRGIFLGKINGPPRANNMAAMRGILKEWEKHLRYYHAAGGTEYTGDEINNMLIRRMLPHDERNRLTHR